MTKDMLVLRWRKKITNYELWWLHRSRHVRCDSRLEATNCELPPAAHPLQRKIKSFSAAVLCPSKLKERRSVLCPSKLKERRNVLCLSNLKERRSVLCPSKRKERRNVLCLSNLKERRSVFCLKAQRSFVLRSSKSEEVSIVI